MKSCLDSHQVRSLTDELDGCNRKNNQLQRQLAELESADAESRRLRTQLEDVQRENSMLHSKVA